MAKSSFSSSSHLIAAVTLLTLLVMEGIPQCQASACPKDFKDHVSFCPVDGLNPDDYTFCCMKYAINTSSPSYSCCPEGEFSFPLWLTRVLIGLSVTIVIFVIIVISCGLLYWKKFSPSMDAKGFVKF